VYYQQQDLITVDNSYREELEKRTKNICHLLAVKLTHCKFDKSESINKYNRKYMELLNSCLSETDVLRIEKQLFEDI
jgi:hypothetical protein